MCTNAQQVRKKGSENTYLIVEVWGCVRGSISRVGRQRGAARLRGRLQWSERRCGEPAGLALWAAAEEGRTPGLPFQKQPINPKSKGASRTDAIIPLGVSLRSCIQHRVGFDAQKSSLRPSHIFCNKKANIILSPNCNRNATGVQINSTRLVIVPELWKTTVLKLYYCII